MLIKIIIHIIYSKFPDIKYSGHYWELAGFQECFIFATEYTVTNDLRGGVEYKPHIFKSSIHETVSMLVEYITIYKLLKSLILYFYIF